MRRTKPVNDTAALIRNAPAVIAPATVAAVSGARCPSVRIVPRPRSSVPSAVRPIIWRSTSAAASGRLTPRTARSAAARASCTWSPATSLVKCRFGSSAKSSEGSVTRALNGANRGRLPQLHLTVEPDQVLGALEGDLVAQAEVAARAAQTADLHPVGRVANRDAVAQLRDPRGVVVLCPPQQTAQEDQSLGRRSRQRGAIEVVAAQTAKQAARPLLTVGELIEPVVLVHAQRNALDRRTPLGFGHTARAAIVPDFELRRGVVEEAGRDARLEVLVAREQHFIGDGLAAGDGEGLRAIAARGRHRPEVGLVAVEVVGVLDGGGSATGLAESGSARSARGVRSATGGRHGARA